MTNDSGYFIDQVSWRALIKEGWPDVASLVRERRAEVASLVRERGPKVTSLV
jgi:hypothetical protein